MIFTGWVGSRVGGIMLKFSSQHAFIFQFFRSVNKISWSAVCEQVALLEWTGDVEMFMLNGYGNSLNYKIGVNLMEDVFESMKNAIKARQAIYIFTQTRHNLNWYMVWKLYLLCCFVEKQVPGRLYEKARLRFAETVIPFTCLLWLFLEEEGEGILCFSSSEVSNIAMRQRVSWDNNIL